MAGWHRDTNTVLAAALNSLQQVCQLPVVLTHLIVLLHVLTERNQVIAAVLGVVAPLQLGHEVVQLSQLGFAQLVDILQQQVNIVLAKLRAAVRHRHPR